MFSGGYGVGAAAGPWRTDWREPHNKGFIALHLVGHDPNNPARPLSLRLMHNLHAIWPRVPAAIARSRRTRSSMDGCVENCVVSKDDGI